MKVVDLFSGCGGMSLGFEKAGFDVVGAFDNWDAAIEIYKANFKHPIFKADLSNEDFIPTIKGLNPDLIVGGPPCQDYSIAGKREMGKRANLTIKFGEIVSQVKPNWVVFENVYNIERFPTLPQLKEILRNAGYGISTRVLDASLCGVPQKRKRFFLIGKLNAKNGFFDDAFVANMSDKSMTVRDYLGDTLNTQYYYMHPRSYNRRAVFSIDEPSATIRGINRPIPDNYKKHPADKADVLDGVRALTTRERGYLQTFPDSFLFPGAKTDVELAIGNAVPPNLAKYIAQNILLFEQTNKERR
ncbi:MAG: DNA cytosine methyltransferase [Bacteroidales bacterium]|nr:DNA cytosine methyltransferase [Bacteroidales bacterium]